MKKIIISGMVFSSLASSVIVGIVLYSSTQSKPYGIESASAATAHAMQKVPATDSQSQLIDKPENIGTTAGPDVKTAIGGKLESQPGSNVEAFTGLKAIQTTLPYNQLTAVIPYPSHEKTVYLTFDDGPGPGDTTKQIIDILDKNQIQGSFFWVGNNLANWLEKDPTNIDFAHQMLEKGEVIGSHTMAHTSLGHRPLASQTQLIQESVNFISDHIGHPVTYFRPPYGSVDSNTYKAAESTKEVIAYWKVDSEDWKYPNNPEKVLSNITSEVEPGAIILMHEKPTSVAMLQNVIDTLRAKGYDFAPLPTVPVPQP